MPAQARPTLQGPTRWVWAAVIVVLAALVSLARLVAINRNALETVLFAEDGIFPLCVAKADAFSCLIDPYAGYLIFLPRVLAIPIAELPLESWALAANLIAAASAGVLALVVFASLAGWGLSPLWSSLIALVPVTAPIVGFEAINVYASIYMPLLFTMTIVLITWTEDRRPWLPAVGLLVTALTIPSAIVLLIPLAVLLWKRTIDIRDGAVVSAALIAGLVAQLVVALSADNPRQVTISFASLRGWVDAIPIAISTVWPGVSFGPATVFGIFAIPVQTATGWLVAGAITFTGLWLVVRSERVGIAVGSMLLVGVAAGAIPTIIGYASNRYFVIPVLLWIAAALIALGSASWRRPTRVWVVTTGVLMFAWWPAFAASSWRANASPSWETEVARVSDTCRSDPGAVVDVLFTPDWPMPHIEVFEPTTGQVPCLSLGLWRQ